MMDCHILSAAHNATITGPKCRVCAAFTIEMRRSVGIENLIISFPWGPRAALSAGLEGDKCILAVPRRHRRVTVWFQHQSPNGLSKANSEPTQRGEIFMSVSAILVHLSAVHHGRNRQTWHTGHIWFPTGDEMVRGWQQCEAAALQHSAVSKAICISGADCEAPAGGV